MESFNSFSKKLGILKTENSYSINSFDWLHPFKLPTYSEHDFERIEINL